MEQEIAALLHIHKEASAHGQSLKNISDAAYARLVQINKEMSRDTWLDGSPKEPVAEPIPEGDEAGEGEVEGADDEDAETEDAA